MGKLDFISILTLIGSILTFIITYFNKGQKEYENLLKEYFDKIVIVYINKHRKQNNINPVKFIKRNLKNHEYFIPSYILYLVKNNNRDELHKVIIEDYKEKFPNNKNSFISTLDNISNIISLLSMLIYFIISIPIIFSIIFGVISLIEDIYSYLSGVKGEIIIHNIAINDIIYSLLLVISGLIMLIILKFSMRLIISTTKDDYTLSKKKIEKIIKKKVKLYDNNNEKYYID